MLFTDYAPSVIEINSLGIGLSQNTNIDTLDLRSDEYLVIGERENTSNSTNDIIYNMIVNRQGVGVNTSRRHLDSKLSPENQIKGFYVNDSLICDGTITTSNLNLLGVTISGDINSDTVKEIFNSVNTISPQFFSGYNALTRNMLANNIYTDSYVTIGGQVETYYNKNPLNIVSIPDKTVENIHFSMKNTFQSDELENSSFRMGIMGRIAESPAIITTTTNMPLEFHISKSSDNMNILYDEYNNLPNYIHINSNNLPSMVIDKRGNVVIGGTETDYLEFNEKYMLNSNTIENIKVAEYSKLKIDGSAFIKNIITHDYVTNCNMNIDDIYIRKLGQTFKTNQIIPGEFDTGIFTFNSNLYINDDNGNNVFFTDVDSKTLYVNDTIKVDNIIVDENLSTTNLLINEGGIATFNANAIFNTDISFNKNINVSNSIFINDGELYYNDVRLSAINVNQISTEISMNKIYEYVTTESSLVNYYKLNNYIEYNNDIINYASDRYGIISIDSLNFSPAIKLFVGDTIKIENKIVDNILIIKYNQDILAEQDSTTNIIEYKFINSGIYNYKNNDETYTGGYIIIEKNTQVNLGNIDYDSCNVLLYYSFGDILNISGSNLAVPGRLGIGIGETDSYLNQLTIQKQNDNFEMCIKDKNNDDAIDINTYLGHFKNISENDNSFVIYTDDLNDKQHNIYFYPGKTEQELNQLPPTLSINQTDKVGINIKNPLKTLHVNGEILCDELYIKSEEYNFKVDLFLEKHNKNIYYLNNDENNKNKYCINIDENIDTNNFKSLNINGGINTIGSQGYYENNERVSTCKILNSDNIKDINNAYINDNIIIGWRENSDNNYSKPLNIRNLSQDNYNDSIIRLYRGFKKGGNLNSAIYTGIDFCNYNTILNNNREHFKWYMYRNHDLETADNFSGILQFGYTNGSEHPTHSGLDILFDQYNNDYYIDINRPANYKPKINKGFFTNKKTVTIYGDLEVTGSIFNDNIMVSNSISSKSSDISNNIINNYSGFNDDIFITGNNISLLHNSITGIGNISSNFVNYINNHIVTNSTPNVIIYSDKHNPITSFNAPYNNDSATIELGLVDFNEPYNINKNNVKFKLSKYDNNSNQSLFEFKNNNEHTFTSFYDTPNSIYVNMGKNQNNYNDNYNSNITLHINNNSDYLLQLTNEEKEPRINLHRKAGNTNQFWTIEGPDNLENLNFKFSENNNNDNLPSNSCNVIVITKEKLFGINENNPETTIHAKSENNTSLKLVHKYTDDGITFNNPNSYVSIINSNLHLDNNYIYDTDNNTYSINFDFNISSNNYPNYNTNNELIHEGFKNSSYFINKHLFTKEYEFNTYLYKNIDNYILNYSNIAIDISYDNTYELGNVLSVDSLDFNGTIHNINSIFNIPNIPNYNEYTLSIPQNNIYNIEYNNNTTLYSDLSYLELNYINSFNITSNNCLNHFIYEQNSNIIDTSNFIVNTTFNTYLYKINDFDNGLANFDNLSYYNSSIIDINYYTKQYDNIEHDGLLHNVDYKLYTSNILYYNSNSYDNLNIDIFTTKDYKYISTIKAPISLIIDDYSINTNIDSNISYIDNSSNFNFNINHNDYLKTNMISDLQGSLYTETDIIINEIINTSDDIYLFNTNIASINYKIIINDYIEKYNYFNENTSYSLKTNTINSVPHIILQNTIDTDSEIPFGKINKIFSKDGTFELHSYDIDTYTELPLITINNNGNTFIYGDTTIEGNSYINGDTYINNLFVDNIYDKLGNSIILNNSNMLDNDYVYTTSNFNLNSSNIIFTTTDFNINSSNINLFSSNLNIELFTTNDNDNSGFNIYNNILSLDSSENYELFNIFVEDNIHSITKNPLSVKYSHGNTYIDFGKNENAYIGIGKEVSGNYGIEMVNDIQTDGVIYANAFHGSGQFLNSVNLSDLTTDNLPQGVNNLYNSDSRIGLISTSSNLNSSNYTELNSYYNSNYTENTSNIIFNKINDIYNRGINNITTIQDTININANLNILGSLTSITQNTITPSISSNTSLLLEDNQLDRNAIDIIQSNFTNDFINIKSIDENGNISNILNINYRGDINNTPIEKIAYLDNVTYDIKLFVEDNSLYSSNYTDITSNFIIEQINNLNIDNITQGSSNKFIINDEYDGNLSIDGDFTIKGDLFISGETSTINSTTYNNTEIYTIDILEINNDTQTISAPTLSIIQHISDQNIIQCSNINSEGSSEFIIINNHANLGINTEPTEKLDVNGNIKFNGTINNVSVNQLNYLKFAEINYNINSNFILETSNILINSIYNSSNYIDIINYNLNNTSNNIIDYVNHSIDNISTDDLISDVSFPIVKSIDLNINIQPQYTLSEYDNYNYYIILNNNDNIDKNYSLKFLSDTVADILLVGGGGAGVNYDIDYSIIQGILLNSQTVSSKLNEIISNITKPAGAGGGGGGVLYRQDVIIPRGIYDVKVGAGANFDNNGQNYIDEDSIITTGNDTIGFGAIAKGGGSAYKNLTDPSNPKLIGGSYFGYEITDEFIIKNDPTDDAATIKTYNIDTEIDSYNDADFLGNVGGKGASSNKYISVGNDEHNNTTQGFDGKMVGFVSTFVNNTNLNNTYFGGGGGGGGIFDERKYSGKAGHGGGGNSRYLSTSTNDGTYGDGTSHSSGMGYLHNGNADGNYGSMPYIQNEANDNVEWNNSSLYSGGYNSGGGGGGGYSITETTEDPDIPETFINNIMHSDNMTGGSGIIIIKFNSRYIPVNHTSNLISNHISSLNLIGGGGGGTSGNVTQEQLTQTSNQISLRINNLGIADIDTGNLISTEQLTNTSNIISQHINTLYIDNNDLINSTSNVISIELNDFKTNVNELIAPTSNLISQRVTSINQNTSNYIDNTYDTLLELNTITSNLVSSEIISNYIYINNYIQRIQLLENFLDLANNINISFIFIKNNTHIEPRRNTIGYKSSTDNYEKIIVSIYGGSQSFTYQWNIEGDFSNGGDVEGNSGSLETSTNEVYLTDTSPGFNIISFGNNLEKVSITITDIIYNVSHHYEYDLLDINEPT